MTVTDKLTLEDEIKEILEFTQDLFERVSKSLEIDKSRLEN